MKPLASARAQALAPSIIREMSRRRRPSSLDLTLGQPSLPPDQALLARAHARMSETGFGYTENAGLADLRALIAAHHALPDRGGPEHVVVTVGCEQGIYLALTACVDPGDEVLIPEPSFPAYRGVVPLIGGVAVPYPIGRETGLVPRAEAIAARITDKTRAIVLCDPSNPFGTVTPEDELDRIAAVAAQHGLTVVTDEIYRDLRYDGRPHPSFASRYDRTVVVGGLSKSCALTGYRLGYVIGDAALMKHATLVNQLMVTCAPRPAQLVAIEVFENPEVLTAHVPFYMHTRARLRAEAEAMPEDAPLLLGDGAFYAIVDVSAHADGDPLQLALQLLDEEDVVVVPGVAFGPSGDWFWRMSYAGGPDIAGEGLSRIARFLSSRAAR